MIIKKQMLITSCSHVWHIVKLQLKFSVLSPVSFRTIFQTFHCTLQHLTFVVICYAVTKLCSEELAHGRK